MARKASEQALMKEWAPRPFKQLVLKPLPTYSSGSKCFPMALTGLLSIIVAAYCFLGTSALPAPVVDVGYAKYIGVLTRPNTAVYLGIPYAEPPLGERRFKKTVPLDKNRVTTEAAGAVIDASSFKPFCIQGSIAPADRGGAGSEDCLRVDIYKPIQSSPTSNLPVLVYIHGGAYAYGAPKNWPFDNWIDQQPHLIIVSVYYRLSALGFLAHPELTGTHGDMNAGLWDQLEALKWVQQHIAYFGGDPTKVTISGHSAGASSVELHLTAFGGTQQNPFHQAITQSIFRTSVMLPSQRTAQFQDLAQRTSCANGTFETQISCLRQVKPVLLMQAADIGWEQHNTTLAWLWTPVVDGNFVPDYPINLLNQGRYQNVPILAGGTSNESFIGLNQNLTFSQAFLPLWANISPENIAALETVYSQHSPWTQGNASRNAAGEAMNRCTTVLGGKYFKPAYGYRYNQPSPPYYDISLVAHGAENWMFFNGTSIGSNGTAIFHPLTPIAQAFSRELIAYWTSFARSGSPNTYKVDLSPQWPEYGAGTRAVLQLAKQAGLSGSYVEGLPADEVLRCETIFAQVAGMQN